MMTQRKRKTLYWVFKIMSVLISCAFPILAIYERFPLFGNTRSVGVGGMLILFVVLFVFRRTVFNFLRERLNLKHAPPLFGWLILIMISYTMLFISKFLADITIVFWMGLIGSAIGTFLTFIAENFLRVENKDNG